MMRLLLVSVLCLHLTACARPLPEGVTELTYATPYPPSHPFSRADIRWMDFVEQRSGGRLIIRPIWSGSLLSSDMSMEELRHGVADIGLITPIYTRGGTHLLRIQTGFASGAESVESQVALYRCLEARVPQISHELEGLKVLAVQGGLLPGIVTASRPVRQLTDLEGLRIRAPTELLPVLGKLGADPVNMPMGEVYSALAKGVIDGVVASPDTLHALHLAEVARYYFALKVPRGGYPARAMNAQRYAELAPWQQEVLSASTTVWEEALAEEIYRSETEGLSKAKGRVIFFEPTAAEQHVFDELYLRDAQESARILEKFGIDGDDAYRVARAAMRRDGQVVCGGKA